MGGVDMSGLEEWLQFIRRPAQDEEVAVTEDQAGPPFVTVHKLPSLTTSMAPRSALKSTSITPISVMKDLNCDKFHMPAQKIRHWWSVSFSDRKRDGAIRGLRTKPHESDDDVGTIIMTTMTSLDPSESSSGCSLSARMKRLAEMMHKLEITEQEFLGVERRTLGENLLEM
ncbi:hypothetical protein BKA82DRAFT_4420925 [Pisolithus tinctorius]|nr:hypothetical protein BKA82DRAFT_4420925 [Pisolithus tinctorius]